MNRSATLVAIIYIVVISIIGYMTYNVVDKKATELRTYQQELTGDYMNDK